MSSTWIVWYLLAALTGHPLLALAAVAAIAWGGDRLSFRFLPSPWRALARWRRVGELRRVLAVNPHDRRARLELADLLLARRPGEAAALARANVEAGDEDVATAHVYGAALARSGQDAQAEHVLEFARGVEPGFRMGELDLELGKVRLARRDFAGAREALERLVAARPGTVEGRWHLARALEGLGDRAAARRVRDDAWREYTALPRFRRREERRFAAKLRPVRAALILGGCVAAVVALLALAAR